MCAGTQTPRHITVCACGSTEFTHAGIQWFDDPTTHFVRDVQYKRGGEVGWDLWTCCQCGTTRLDMNCKRSVLRVRKLEGK